MLKLYPSYLINGITVFEDDDLKSPTFYCVPQNPTFRTDEHGNPLLKLIKYKTVVTDKNGNQGGGFLIFDSQLVLSDADKKAIQTECDQILANRVIPAAALDPAAAQLQQLHGLQSSAERANQSFSGQAAGLGHGAPAGTVGLKANGKPVPAVLAQPTYVKGTTTLTLLDSDGSLIQKIESAGKPSLLGSMISCFTAELSPQGVAVVEGAMPSTSALASGLVDKTSTGGVVQIAYDLFFWGVLPDVTGHVWFDSMKFASFYQTIDKSTGHWWSGAADSEKEKLREQFIASQSGGVEFNFEGVQSTDPAAQKLITDLTNWGWQQLSTAVQGASAASTAAAPVATAPTDPSSGQQPAANPGVSAAGTGADLGQDRTSDGKDHTTHDEQSSSLSSFDETYKQKDSALFEVVPQGTLPNPTPAQMEACTVTINADDPFFDQIHASILVNADLLKFNIHSVTVNCFYPVKPTPGASAAAKGLDFTKPDDVLKFDSDTDKADMTYGYHYTVNYLDQNDSYKSPQLAASDSVLTLNVGTLGVLFISLTVNNVDFKTVANVQVAVTYPDPDPSGAAVSREFSFSETHKTENMVVVMLRPIDKKYKYQVTYVMVDGSQLVRPWVEDNSQELYFDSPFTPRTVSFLAEADFVNDVDNIFLSIDYTDAANKYSQSRTFTFNKSTQETDWKFMVLNGSQGVVSYSGVISHFNHTTENIPVTVATGKLVTFGPPNQTIFTVTPDASLLDFTTVKLVTLNFAYSDPDNGINNTAEIKVTPTAVTPASWTFFGKDPAKKAYTYQASFYMGTPPKKVDVPAVIATDTQLVLMMPSS